MGIIVMKIVISGGKSLGFWSKFAFYGSANVPPISDHNTDDLPTPMTILKSYPLLILRDVWLVNVKNLLQYSLRLLSENPRHYYACSRRKRVGRRLQFKKCISALEWE